jgi:hypothetical protein
MAAFITRPQFLRISYTLNIIMYDFWIVNKSHGEKAVSRQIRNRSCPIFERAYLIAF